MNGLHDSFRDSAGGHDQLSDPNKNLSCVLIAAQTVECKEMPIPKISETDVLVEVVSTGLCGSDVSILVMIS